MASSPMGEFLQNLRRVSLRRDETGMTDGQLLDTYIRGREEAAFEALVRRHGPMVWGVCRRVLCNEGDAEDAFQATFFVLVRKATSIVPREKVANWLYGVARQTAVKARAMTMKRKVREKQVKDMPEPTAPEQDDSHPLLPLLDEELSRLPDKYRMAIVLCDLEGKSYKEAARQQGCPEGTLSARLARGRTMLAKRLARHGSAVTGGVLATILSQSASAGVPASVASSTIKAASLFAAGQAAAAGVISVKAAALTEGVLKTMLLAKLKIATSVLFVTAAAVGSGGMFYYGQAAKPALARQEAGSTPSVESKQQRGQDNDKTKNKAEASKNILQNAGFEEGEESPAHWSEGANLDGVKYIWDNKRRQRGKASVCLHKTAQRYFPIAQWYQIVDRKGDEPALRVAAQVRAERVTKAIIDVIFLDENEEMIQHQWVSYIGAKKANDPPANHNWKEYAGRVAIPPTAKKIQVALQIYGPGKVWFDEVSAEYTK